MQPSYLSLDYLNSGASRTLNDEVPNFNVNGMLSTETESIYEREGYNTQLDQQSVVAGLESPAYEKPDLKQSFDFLKDGVIEPIDESYYQQPTQTYWTSSRIIGVTIILIAVLSVVNKFNKSEELLSNLTKAIEPFVIHIIMILGGIYLVK